MTSCCDIIPDVLRQIYCHDNLHKCSTKSFLFLSFLTSLTHTQYVSTDDIFVHQSGIVTEAEYRTLVSQSCVCALARKL
jgi:hypothetical protein